MAIMSSRVAAPHVPQHDCGRTMQSALREHEPKFPAPPDPVEPPQSREPKTAIAPARQATASGFIIREPMMLYRQKWLPLAMPPQAMFPVHIPAVQSAAVLHNCMHSPATPPSSDRLMQVYPAAQSAELMQGPDRAVPAAIQTGV